MDQLLELLLVFISVYAMAQSLVGPMKAPSVGERIIDALEKARQRGLLGPPRILKRFGRLYVVGFGESHPVGSKEEGLRVIARMQGEVDKILNALPSLARASGRPARRASSVASRQARIASPGGWPRVRSLVTDSAATTPAMPIASDTAQVYAARVCR